METTHFYTLPQTNVSMIILPTALVIGDLVSYVGDRMMVNTATGVADIRFIDMLLSMACEALKDINSATYSIQQRVHWLFDQYLEMDTRNIGDLNTIALHWTSATMGLAVIYQQFQLYNPDGLTYWSYCGLDGHDIKLNNIGG